MSGAEREGSERAARPASGPGDGLRPRHLLIGWWWLLAFLTLGLVLDAFHGLKVGWYMDVEHSTRRLMWTLAHTHGTLLGLVNLGFAAVLPVLTEWPARRRLLASNLLLVASVLMPGGFLLGGIFIHGGDPGLGAILVPIGGVLLIAGVALTVLAVTRKFLPREDGGEETGEVARMPVQVPRARAYGVLVVIGAIAVVTAGFSVLRSLRSAPDEGAVASTSTTAAPGATEPDADDALIAEATAARLADDPLRAIEISREVLSRKPHHYGAKYQLASALQAVGQRDAALAAWRSFHAAASEIDDRRWELYALERIKELTAPPPAEPADRGREQQEPEPKEQP